MACGQFNGLDDLALELALDKVTIAHGTEFLADPAHCGSYRTSQDGDAVFQNFVFAQLSGVGVMYNPPEVMALMHAIYKSPGDPSKIDQLEHLLSRYRADFPGQCLLISKPDIPGEMYDAYPEFEDNLRLLYRLMPRLSSSAFAGIPLTGCTRLTVNH